MIGCYSLKMEKLRQGLLNFLQILALKWPWWVSSTPSVGLEPYRCLDLRASGREPTFHCMDAFSTLFMDSIYCSVKKQHNNLGTWQRALSANTDFLFYWGRKNGAFMVYASGSKLVAIRKRSICSRIIRWRNQISTCLSTANMGMEIGAIKINGINYS